ncbi:MAG: hypothetical protein PHN89_04090, partial [Candidatus Pacebacteria bacterium]|nr:hypothetical protein [Candidatus Paceibacterota bacterium]
QEKEEKSKIDLLEKKLYNRDAKPWVPRRRVLPHESSETPKEWDDSKDIEPELDSREDTPDMTHRIPIFQKIFIASVLFFIVASAFGFYMYFLGGNTVSADNISISVLGPVSVGGGEPLPLDVTIQNRNKSPLEATSLVITYPDGTKYAKDLSIDLPRERDDIGDLASGDISHFRINPVLFGEEGSTKAIKFSLEYRIRDSNGIFNKDFTYNVGITSTPITLTIDSLKEINSGQSVEITATLVSNSPGVINHLLLSASYPFGFSFQSANPKPVYQNALWDLGDVETGGKRTIKIRGQLDGQDGEERIFKFSAGLPSGKNNKSIGVAFLSASDSITIQKPFIGLSLALDGNTSKDAVVKSGQTVRAKISWSNNLASQVLSGAVIVKFSGNLLNKSSVIPEQGFYRSSDNTITWDKTTNNELLALDPGAEGSLAFQFSTLPLVQGGVSIRNPELRIEVSAKGSRVSDRDVPEEVDALVTRNIKISTDLNLSSRLVYSIGPFENSGPLPPRADQKTTYTVLWGVTNSSNSVSGAKVSAVLPSYVDWKNLVNPSSEQVSFNPVSREVVWNLGNVKENTGVTASPRSVAFQVFFLPSVSQIGASPVMIGDATLSGVDDWNGDDVGSRNRALTTEIVSDPNYSEGQQKVEQ